MTLILTLFVAGFLTILLPCILPLIPIVLGVSIAGRSKMRPLYTVGGMVISFVAFTFLLLVVLRQFVEVADYMRIGTYYVLLLFGLGFLTHNKIVQFIGAIAGAFFFQSKGVPSIAIAAALGVFSMYVGGAVASRIQQFGANVQSKARTELGQDNPMTAFVMGLTMGLVWVPCAGPALGFAFTLVRDEPGLRALLYLFSYGLGTAVPLLMIGYGGQYAVHSVRAISQFSGRIKQISGVLLILTAVAFQQNWFIQLQTWFVANTGYGTLGTRIEERLFGENIDMNQDLFDAMDDSSNDMGLLNLPKISRAPEFTGLGPWHNSEPFTLESLKGKVVLVDFWTYSCINCIRTLPYLREYWDKYQDKPFVLIGVHTPEFVFEKSEQNVADAIDRLDVTWPVAQDNDYGTWRAFANRYWPAKYLIDADGYIRYTHFGEGAYDETDLAIQSLLAEIGAIEGPMETVENPDRKAGDRTPEIYLGSRSWPALQNGAALPTDEVIEYSAPETVGLHNYALVGSWQLVDEEKQVLRSDKGTILMKFQGGEINLVMGIEGSPASVTVEVDGEEVKTFTIDHQGLYELWTGESGMHDIAIRITGEGAEGYAFTFGS